MESLSVSQDMTTTAKLRLNRYEQLIELAFEQQSILVSGDNSRLSDNLMRFDHVILELKHLDNRNVLLSAQLNRQADDCARTNLSNEYKALIKSTEEKAFKLRELISTNTKLLTNAIDLVKFSMDLLYKFSTPLTAEPSSYSQAIIFDARV